MNDVYIAWLNRINVPTIYASSVLLATCLNVFAEGFALFLCCFYGLFVTFHCKSVVLHFLLSRVAYIAGKSALAG
jgi:hypothetical protein